ncbi:MAG: toxin-antitoxin system HicB family antitoxin [Planctomycetes bacterium]|nr:toxin-antitoxin system HicB family antitoxin [Planctomycetota bacterium]
MENIRGTTLPADFERCAQDVHEAALKLFLTKPDWAKFFREVLGVTGLVHRTFVDSRELAAFQRTPECREIRSMLHQLRTRRRDTYDEPMHMITVRLPKSLHQALQAEAHLHQVSMNRLCITKLLQVVDLITVTEATAGESEAGAAPMPRNRKKRGS